MIEVRVGQIWKHVSGDLFTITVVDREEISGTVHGSPRLITKTVLHQHYQLLDHKDPSTVCDSGWHREGLHASHSTCPSCGGRWVKTNVESSNTVISTSYILGEVGIERNRQKVLKKEGRFAYTCADVEISHTEKLTILVEEVGEAARAVLEMQRLANDTHFKDANKQLRKELIQVAAVAVAWVESL